MSHALAKVLVRWVVELGLPLEEHLNAVVREHAAHEGKVAAPVITPQGAIAIFVAATQARGDSSLPEGRHA